MSRSAFCCPETYSLNIPLTFLSWSTNLINLSTFRPGRCSASQLWWWFGQRVGRGGLGCQEKREATPKRKGEQKEKTKQEETKKQEKEVPQEKEKGIFPEPVFLYDSVPLKALSPSFAKKTLDTCHTDLCACLYLQKKVSSSSSESSSSSSSDDENEKDEIQNAIDAADEQSKFDIKNKLDSEKKVEAEPEEIGPRAMPKIQQETQQASIE